MIDYATVLKAEETTYDDLWESTLSKDDVNKAISQLRYPDAWLRDLAGKWVMFDRRFVPSAEELIRLTECQFPLLLGFLYVDRAKGFRLRVHYELVPAAPGGQSPYRCRRLEKFRWELSYEEIKKIPVREIDRCEGRSLGLPPFPVRLVNAGHFDTAVSYCRRIRILDPLRQPGHPDVVQAWNAVGDDPRGEKILVYTENERSEGLFTGTVVAATASDVTGTRITVALFELEGKIGLFRVSDAVCQCDRAS